MFGRLQNAPDGAVSSAWTERLSGRLSAVRVVAAMTVAYSIAITIAPRLLAGPCRLVGPDGQVPTGIATLIRSVGVRDAAPAAVLLLAPPGAAASTLTAARVVSDAADAVWFGLLPLDSSQRAKIGGAAAGWAAVEALAQLADQRR